MILHGYSHTFKITMFAIDLVRPIFKNYKTLIGVGAGREGVSYLKSEL
jgi:hypothetical protein